MTQANSLFASNMTMLWTILAIVEQPCVPMFLDAGYATSHYSSTTYGLPEKDICYLSQREMRNTLGPACRLLK